MARADNSPHVLAKGLGWFSIAVGTAELVAPHAIGRALGMEERARVVQAYGLREIASGIAILASDDPKPWVWGRVAGDAMDLATLAPGLNHGNPRRGAVGAALAGAAAITLLDFYCARRLGAEGEEEARVYDYSDRSGFPDAPDKMRGAARA